MLFHGRPRLPGALMHQAGLSHSSNMCSKAAEHVTLFWFLPGSEQYTTSRAESKWGESTERRAFKVKKKRQLHLIRALVPVLLKRNVQSR